MLLGCCTCAGPAGWLAACVLGVLATPVWGTPYFSIETYAEWEEALYTGAVEPLDTGEWMQYSEHWQTEYVEGEPYPADTEFWYADLYPMEDLPAPYPEGSMLVMSWGQMPYPGMYSSAWKYTYPEDPDLSNAVLTLTAYAPTGINKGLVRRPRQPATGIGRGTGTRVRHPDSPTTPG